MELYFDGEEQISESISDIMKKAAIKCVVGEGVDPEKCQVSISFVSPEEIKLLNSQYRGIDKETDVLSFPQYESLDEMHGEIIELGDVVISKKQAEKQAIEFGHSYERELIYLFVHSILHLLGYDHMNDEERAIMRRREEDVMTYLHLER